MENRIAVMKLHDYPTENDYEADINNIKLDKSAPLLNSSVYTQSAEVGNYQRTYRSTDSIRAKQGITAAFRLNISLCVNAATYPMQVGSNSKA